jgi:hypothetical protein
MRSENELCIDTLEVENKMLRARNERLEVELSLALQDTKKLVKAYRELIIKHDRLEAKHQK